MNNNLGPPGATRSTVSVVIPAYNRATTIRRAIDSVLAQTWQDFEVVIVDDGSTDTTADVVRAVNDPRVALIQHQQNRGGSAARNTGIRASSAPFIAFLDSDDEWVATKLERQLAVFLRSDDRLALVYTGVDRMTLDGCVTRHVPSRRFDLARDLLIKNVIGETSLGMVRRSALDCVGGFDESLPSSQDLDLWLRLCERFDADLVPEPLARVAKGSADRISADLQRTAVGRQLYCQKHRDKMIRRHVLHIFLRKLGWWYQREAQNPTEARRYYKESLAAVPFAPATYGMLFVSFLPLRCVERLAELKHSVVRFMRLRAQMPHASNRRQPGVTGTLQAPRGSIRGTEA
jgi:glycosyltransferase involved in cell wall biosynthesis